MPRSRTWSSVFRSAAKKTSATARTVTATTETKTKSANNGTLKDYLSSVKISSPSPSFISHNVTRSSKESLKPKPLQMLGASASKRTRPSSTVYSVLPELIIKGSDSDSESEVEKLSRGISSVLCDRSSVISPDSQGTGSKNSRQIDLDIPWFQNLSAENVNLRRKEMCRLRKGTWIFKSNYKLRIDKLFTVIDHKMGHNSVLGILRKLGCESGAKEYNALMKIYIKKAQESDDEDVALEQISIAFGILRSMKEEGFQIDEETYSPFLMYLIDMGMVEAFEMFCATIEDDDPTTLAKLGYYKMLLYIRVNDEEKIRDLCSYVVDLDVHGTFDLRENYLLALCEKDRKDELSRLLEVIDITTISSLPNMISIFDSLGRLSFDSLAKKFLLTLKDCDVILTFKNLHSLLDMAPSSKSLEKLVTYCSDLHQMYTALDIVRQMCREGLALSVDMINSILHACEGSFEFNLVQEIYSLICCHNLLPNNETFRIMISLKVKMKHFASAYDMLDDLKKFNLTPTTSLYNVIMLGCFREKDINGGLMVLKKMELAGVEPDSQTYAYLIANCNSEDQINKYFEKLTFAGLQLTKQIFMALISAYAICGRFEKAKQVLLDGRIPLNCVDEIKSALVSALASHGQISDALCMYDEIKKAGGNVEPKSVTNLIAHFESGGELSRLLKILEDLKQLDYWVEGCCRTISWCIRNKHLSSAVNLLKQLKERFGITNDLTMQVIFDEVFSLIPELEPTDLQIGLGLLKAIKEELCVPLSRQSLDFLLSACAKAKDLHNALLIWQEYKAAGYPYNVINYLRMYQTLMASGDPKSAKVMLSKIPKDDPHVLKMIQAYQRTYVQSSSSTKEKKVKKKKGRAGGVAEEQHRKE